LQDFLLLLFGGECGVRLHLTFAQEQGMKNFGSGRERHGEFLREGGTGEGCP